MKKIIDQIEILKKEFDSLLPMEEYNSNELWQKFRLEWNYNSNHIEGNTLTYGDTKLLFRLGDDFKAQNNSLKDVNEMRAHDVAVHLIKEWAKEKNRKLTEKDIRELNEIILVKDFWADAQTSDGQPTRRLIKVGQYKEHPNHVILKSGEVFKYAEPHEVPIKMKELLDWYETQNDEDPLIVAAYLHYKFVLIHPFDDGNGRVSRLLMNYHLMKNGYLPLIIMSADKPNYLYALNQADTGNVNAFVEYLGKQLIWSLEIGIKAANGKSVSEEDDLYKEIEVWKKELKSGISSNPKRTDKRSMEIYDKCIVNLFDLIEKESSIFSDLFLSSKTTRSFKMHTSGFFDLSTIGQRFYRDSPQDNLEKFRLFFEFNTPLNTLDSEKILKMGINVNLDIFSYSFQIDNVIDTRMEKYNYDHFIDQKEMEDLIQIFVSHLFEKIKKITK